jgi:hypothetical protein
MLIEREEFEKQTFKNDFQKSPVINTLRVIPCALKRICLV